jgi:AMP-polyphosphate phosphotransferase
MLELLDLGQMLKKSQYREMMPRLRAELRDLQQIVHEMAIPVVILFEGLDASGKGDSIGSLVYPLDPRGFKVFTTKAPNEEEHFRPFLWRFWTRLPARDEFVFLDRSWYRQLLDDRLDGKLHQQDVLVAAAGIREFERQLTDDAVVLIKFWLHIDKKESARRRASIEADPYEKWRLSQPEWKRKLSFQKWMEAAEEMFALTSTANAPWRLVEANDRLFRRVKVFQEVIASLRRSVEEFRKTKSESKVGSILDDHAEPALDNAIRKAASEVKVDATPSLLDRVDLSQRLERKDYEERLDRLQGRLRSLELECYGQRVSAVIVYEGWDAAGKGGNIKRLTQELDPRGYEVIPIAAPDTTEKSHHYLWRFWKRIPKAGHLAIFDRSWYGRVLVERVEGFADERTWRRAYQEINEFERQLRDSGMVIVKFWLHLSPEEQLRRFLERERITYKRYKITADDWRNRLKWNAYRDAVSEMIERTSTSYAPWTIVEAEDKLWARIKTLSTLVAALEERLHV